MSSGWDGAYQVLLEDSSSTHLRPVNMAMQTAIQKKVCADGRMSRRNRRWLEHTTPSAHPKPPAPGSYSTRQRQATSSSAAGRPVQVQIAIETVRQIMEPAIAPVAPLIADAPSQRRNLIENPKRSRPVRDRQPSIIAGDQCPSDDQQEGRAGNEHSKAWCARLYGSR